MANESPDTIDEEYANDAMPLLPLKDMVVFPRMVVPILVGRPASMAAVEECIASSRPLFVCAQRDPTVELPTRDDLHDTGVACSILQTLRMPDDSLKLVIEGLARGRVLDHNEFETHSEVIVEPLDDEIEPTEERQAAMRVALEELEEYARQTQRVSPEIVASLRGIDDPALLADLICAHMPLPADERQDLLDAGDTDERLAKIMEYLTRENHLQGIERGVRDRVRDQMERGQREYYLQEQLKVIHQELGHGEEGGDEFTTLSEQIAKAKMPKEVRQKAERELSRYQRMPSMSPEAVVVRSYIEWLVDLPWGKRSKDKIDLAAARKQLDEDHYGLEKVKDRILEFLAVRKLSKSTKGPILCLVGPPGVGKTSLGQSIAKAMGRKFVRVSLGGVRDEAEIRGHRRTYIGALPGRIIQNVKKAGVKNPVFILDEIDKMAADFRGDPSSAMLEVLDPEQNKQFSDHYLEVDFDLHEVFFIGTANNDDDIPDALYDRLEIVYISGYTPYEKERIATGFLIPKQMHEAGISPDLVEFKSSGIQAIIKHFTREGGVRELERRIAQICRKVARKVVEANGKVPKKITVTPAMVTKLIGPEEYLELQADKDPRPGVSVGMAWTSSGGDILVIETSKVKGKGDVALTGQLGEIMRESAQAAHTFLRAHYKEYDIPANFWKDLDLHVHVPEGAIPKDGPSAGIPLAVSLLSALREEAPNPGFAMTGEVTLRGRILPVGGIKEKVLAAHRAGMKKVIMPKGNQKDLVDIPKEVKDDLDLILVEELDEAIRHVLPMRPKKPKPRRKKPAAKTKPKAAAKKKSPNRSTRKK